MTVRRWPRRTLQALLTWAFLQVASCSGPAPRSLEELVVMDSLYVDPSSGSPFTGAVERRFEDDSAAVQIEGTLLDGVWDGELLIYHPNGRVRYMGSFSDGERCGPWIENADSLPSMNAYEDLVREVESLGLYPPCEGSS